LLDAAERRFSSDGFSATTIEDIATAANVSRATVYRYYTGRDEIILEVVLREADRFFARVQPRVNAESTLGGAVLELVLSMVLSAGRDQILSALFSVDEAREAGRVMVEGSVIFFERTADFIGPIFEKHVDQLRPGVTVDDASEWILRVVFSFLTVRGPRRRSKDALRDYVRRYLMPALVRG